MDVEQHANKKIVNEVLKIINIFELLKRDNCFAVDLNKFHIKSTNDILLKLLESRDDLEIIDNEIRKVDRTTETARYIEILEQRIRINYKEIEELKYYIKSDEEKLELLRQKKVVKIGDICG